METKALLSARIDSPEMHVGGGARVTVLETTEKLSEVGVGIQILLETSRAFLSDGVSISLS